MTKNLTSKKINFYQIILLIVISLFFSFTIGKSENLSWKHISGKSWNNINELKIDKNNRIYASSNYETYNTGTSGTYISDDKCKTWKEIPFSYYGIYGPGTKIHFCNNGNVLITQNLYKFLLISTDSCKSFKSVKNNSDIVFITQNSKGKLFASGEKKNFYSSDDYGLNWQIIDSSTISTGRTLMFESINDELYKIITNEIQFTTNEGKSWTKLPLTLKGDDYYYSCAVFNNDIYIITKYLKYLKFCTKDKKLTVIKDSLKNSSIISTFIIDKNANVYAVNHEGLFKTDTLFESYDTIMHTPSFSTYYSYISCLCDSDSVLYFGSFYGEIFQYNKNKYFKRIVNYHNNLLQKNIIKMIPISDSTFYALDDSGSAYKTIDCGKNWFNCESDRQYYGKLKNIAYRPYRHGLIGLDSNNRVFSNMIDYSPHLVSNNLGITKIEAITNTSDGNVFAISDKGIVKMGNDLIYNPWLMVDDTIQNGEFLNTNSKFLLIKSNNSYFYLDTEIEKLAKINTSIFAGKTISSMDANDDDEFFLSIPGDGIYFSSNKGKNWYSSDKQLTNKNVTKIKCLSKNKLVAGTKSNGIYYSNIKGQNWENDNSGLDSLNIINIASVDSNSIFCSVKNDGLYICDSISDNVIITQSGWIDSTNYKQNICHRSQFVYLSFSEDASKFYTVSKNSKFQIWDTKSGTLLNESSFNPTNIVSYDFEESLNLLAISHTGQYLNPYLHLYNIITDSLISVILPAQGKTRKGVINDDYTNLMSVFDKNRQKIITSFRWGAFYGQGTFESGGYFDVWDLKDNKQIKSFESYFAVEMKYLSNSNSLCFLGRDGASGMYNWYNSKLSFANLNDYKTHVPKFDTAIGKEVNKIIVSKDEKFVAFYTEKGKIGIYDIRDTIVKGVLQIWNTPFPAPFSGQFLSSTNYLILSTGSKFYIWNFRQNILLDSFRFEDTNENWLIDISPDNKFLIAAGESGRIRFLELSSVFRNAVLKVDEQLSQVQISISPNPASDFIEISLGAQQAMALQIRIYDVFGREVLSNSQLSIFNSQLRVDVSTLVPGLYFVRVGEKVGKFLKI